MGDAPDDKVVILTQAHREPESSRFKLNHISGEVGWQVTKRAIYIAMFIFLVVDLVGYVSLDRNGCRAVFGERSMPTACTTYSDGSVVCPSNRDRACNDDLAWAGRNKVSLDDFSTMETSFVGIIFGILQKILMFVLFHPMMFIYYVAVQPFPFCLPVLFAMGALVFSQWRRHQAEDGRTFFGDKDPKQLLRNQHAETNAGPAKRNRIDAALRGKSLHERPQFKD